MTQQNWETEDRIKAISLARLMGWIVTKRSMKLWAFEKREGGPVWEVFHILHNELSLTSVLTRLEIYEPSLGDPVNRAVNEARAKIHAEWLKERRTLWGLK